MEKKTLIALVAVVALTALAVFSMRAPEKGDRVGERARPVAEIKAERVASLEVAQPGGKDKVTLTKKGDKWQVTSPYDKPAEAGAVKTAVESLEKLKWGDITTEQKSRHAELEVSDDKAVHVVAKDAGGAVLADVYIGKTAGSSTLVRIAGSDAVWQAGELYASAWKRDAKAWREHGIFELKADEVQKVTMKGGGAQATLERLPAPAVEAGKPAPAGINDAKWKVTEGDGKYVKPGMEADATLVNRLVQGLASLRANDFLDDAKPEETGLAAGAPGQIEVSVTIKDGKTAGVRIGAQKAEDFYVQTLDAPQIFTVKKWGLEQVAHLPQDLGSKVLLTIKADQLDQITVTQGTDVVALKAADKTWKADKVADADEGKLKSIAESFADLTGTGFLAPDAPERASLVKPRATVTLKPKAGTPVVLKIGDVRGEEVAIEKAGADAMWVKKFQVDRFLKKPTELGKDKAPPPGAMPPGGMPPGMMPPGMMPPG